MSNFNLLDEPWIDTVRADGSKETLSITGLLMSAHTLADIKTNHPTERTALVRLLLAYLHRALDGPPTFEDWCETWESGQFDIEAIDTYARRWRNRFDLFDPELPFFQVAGLEATGKNAWKPWSEAALDASTPKRPLFTSRSGQAQESRTPAEAALWLVHKHAFDTGGIHTGATGDPAMKDGKSYTNEVGWAGHLTNVLVGGTNLFETLMLNLVPRTVSGAGPDVALSHADDVPAWEKAETFTADSLRDPAAVPTGPVDLFTWQSRRVLLRHENGVVTRVLRCGGPQLPHWNRHDSESHTVWVYSKSQSKKQSKTIYRSLEVDVSVQPWRGLSAFMPTVRVSADKDHIAPTAAIITWLSHVVEELGIQDRIIRLDRSGIVYGGTAQPTVVDRELGDTLAVPGILLSPGDPDVQDMVASSLAMLGDVVKAVGTLAWKLAKSENADNPGVPATTARQQTWSALDGPVRRWLTLLNDDTDLDVAQGVLITEACRLARQVGHDLVHRAGPGAWRPREATSNPAAAWGKFLFDLRQINNHNQNGEVA